MCPLRGTCPRRTHWDDRLLPTLFRTYRGETSPFSARTRRVAGLRAFVGVAGRGFFVAPRKLRADEAPRRSPTDPRAASLGLLMPGIPYERPAARRVAEQRREVGADVGDADLSEDRRQRGEPC